MNQHHAPIFSQYAKDTFNSNGYHHTDEVNFFEWFETPINYESLKNRRRREEEEAKKEVRPHLESTTGPVAQAIMIGILGACIIGLYVLVLV